MSGKKCVFSCCYNRVSENPQPGLLFFSFEDVPSPVSEHWARIVARERCLSNFKPNKDSKICSQHFAPYEISPFKTLYSTAIPTINIGPYDDTVVIDDEENITRKPEEPAEYYNTNTPFIRPDDDIICVIENQISSEPKQLTTTDEDIENQIQWSLVGTSKHFDGLLHMRDQKAPVVPTPQPSTRELQKEYCMDDDVVLIEDKMEYSNHYIESKNDFKNQFSQFIKIYDKQKRLFDVGKGQRKPVPRKSSKYIAATPQTPVSSSLKQVHHDEQCESKTESISKFVKKCRRKTERRQNDNPSKIEFQKTATTQHTTGPEPLPTTATITEQSQTITAYNETVSSSNRTVKLKATSVKQVMTTTQEYATTLQQPLSITATITKQPQSITNQPFPISNTTEQQTAPAQQVEAITQEPTPVQLIKTSQLATPQLMATTPYIIAPVFTAASQNSSQILMYKSPLSVDGNSFFKLLSSPIPIRGTKLSSVCIQENNVKTYYLSNLLPDTTLDILSDEVCDEQANENLQPVTVKTKNTSDY